MDYTVLIPTPTSNHAVSPYYQGVEWELPILVQDHPASYILQATGLYLAKLFMSIPRKATGC